MLKQAKWIWVDKEQTMDAYGEFYSEFLYNGGNVNIKISVDSNYVMYINGKFVDSGQYCDFPYYKVYDDIDITEFCKSGANKLAIIVWYYGQMNLSYYPGKAGLWFEIYDQKEILAVSEKNTLSRYSRAYRNGYLKTITWQLGLSFFYDSTKEDNWKNGELTDFSMSEVIEQSLELNEREIKKLRILNPVESKLIKKSKNYYLFDLSQEEVGYLTLKVKSQNKQLLKIYYGEHINDGMVRGVIGDRDFSVEVMIGEGITEYTNYFRRLGLRYLEVHSEEPLEIDYVTVCPCPYPLKKVKVNFKNPLHQKIYDVSVRTLELCMHEHYEDCPWREQALYTMDSRNQMLCGYYAFNEYAFPRKTLLLISKDMRQDKLLSMCIPTNFDLTIPSFALHYIRAVYEYMIYSGDNSLTREILPKLQTIIDVFIDRIEGGLIKNFPEKEHWNFFEWTKGLDGNLFGTEREIAEASMNCLLSLTLQYLQKICDLLHVDANYLEIAMLMNEAIRKEFYNEKDGLYFTNLIDYQKTELVNAWAVLCGAAKGLEAKRICEALVEKKDLAPITLSMSCFVYDALMMNDKEQYKHFIISDIEQRYKKMLDLGATTFWETELGEDDDDGSGSLCHGWSAMPVYYLRELLE